MTQDSFPVSFHLLGKESDYDSELLENLKVPDKATQIIKCGWEEYKQEEADKEANQAISQKQRGAGAKGDVGEDIVYYHLKKIPNISIEKSDPKQGHRGDHVLTTLYSQKKIVTDTKNELKLKVSDYDKMRSDIQKPGIDAGIMFSLENTTTRSSHAIQLEYIGRKPFITVHNIRKFPQLIQGIIDMLSVMMKNQNQKDQSGLTETIDKLNEIIDGNVKLFKDLKSSAKRTSTLIDQVEIKIIQSIKDVLKTFKS